MSENDCHWGRLSRSMEDQADETNKLRIEDSRPPIAFDLDACRHVLLILKEAGRPLPRASLILEGDEWSMVLQWSRIDGRAWLALSKGRLISHRIDMAGDEREVVTDASFPAHDLTAFMKELDHFTAVKQVIVVRRDLKMRQGKAVSQGSHASGEFMREQILDHLDGGRISLSPDEIEWLKIGMAKITVRADSKEEFDRIAEEAEIRGLKVRTITDSGRTEFHGVPTVTALAIGPTRSAYVDPVTKNLTLL